MTVWPNGLRTIPRVTAEFGPRAPIHTPNGAVTGSFHYGIDLVGWANNKSPCNGVVIFAAYNGGGGNQVNVRADNGDVFHILHNARFLVSKGQRVSEGQDVGVMGTTGNSTGVHCHFETHPGGGAATNPRGYMAQAIPAGGGYTPITNRKDADMPVFVKGHNIIIWPNGFANVYDPNVFEACRLVAEDGDTESSRVATYTRENWAATDFIAQRNAQAAASATVATLKASGIPVTADVDEAAIAAEVIAKLPKPATSYTVTPTA